VIIDVHNHVIPRPAVDLLATEPVYRVDVDGDLVSGGNHPPFRLDEAFHDPAAKLAELDAKGIDCAILSVSPTIFYYEVEAAAGDTMARAANEGLAAMCEHGRERLRWMAHVPLQDAELAATLLEEAAANGCVGVEVGTSIAGERLDEDRFARFWAAAERHAVPVMLHPAYNEPHRGLEPWYLQNVIGNMLETTVAAERLVCAGVLDRHPGLRVLLLHSGGYFPYQAGRLRHARTVRPELGGVGDPWSYVGRLLFDTITHDVQNLRHLVERVGADNVVFGTDLPFDMAPTDPVAELRAALDDDVLRQVAAENPARLFGLEGVVIQSGRR
jgi:aminocarboxymuconate-semialdehyde decarboxylase